MLSIGEASRILSGLKWYERKGFGPIVKGVVY